MKAPAFTYHAPTQLKDALQLLADLPNARVLAGGQSLMPMLNLRVAGPDHLIDLGHIDELKRLQSVEGGLLTGAMCTQRRVERSPMVGEICPLLRDAIRHVGHQQTRNRGTIGGSVSHLDPGAELPVAAAALNATITIASLRGERKVSFSDFAQGYLTSCLEPDEIVTQILWPQAPKGAGAAFMEFNRRPADFAVVSVATQMVLDDNGAIAQSSLALGGVQGAPLVLAMSALIGAKTVNEGIGEDLLRGLDCDGDELYPAEFRLEIASVLIGRALSKALAQARSVAHV